MGYSHLNPLRNQLLGLGLGVGLEDMARDGARINRPPGAVAFAHFVGSNSGFGGNEQASPLGSPKDLNV